MRRFLLGFLAALLLLIAGAYAYQSWKSVEDFTLDDAARAQAPGRFITAPQGITHFDVTGPDSGRVVVLVHGFSVPYYIWDSTAVALSRAGLRVIRYDLYGRGYSDRPEVDYDGALYRAQLDALLDSLRVPGPVDLVGLSFGGFVTADFVVNAPGRVRTLTLVDPVSDTPAPPDLLRAPIVGAWLWNVTRVPGMAAGQQSDFLHPEDHPGWTDQYRPQMRFKGFGRALLSSVLHTSRVDFDSLYSAVAQTGVPVLLIWGKQDRTIPFTRSEVVRRNIPSVEFVAVDSAGHLPHIEQSALVHARILAFLQAHPAQPDAVANTGNVPDQSDDT